MTPDDYIAAAGGCRTVNEFNRLHIDLENELAPADLAALWKLRKRPDLPEEARTWCNAIRRLDRSIPQAPKGFRREQVLPRVQHYVDDVSPPERKGLLIAFCGSTDRLGVPVAAFLQCVDSEHWDVVKVTRQRGRSYLQGWPEGPAEFPELVRSVARAASLDRYAALACLGTSSGGLAAVVAGHILGARSAVGVGARSIDPLNEITAAIGNGRPPATTIWAYATRNAIDHQSTEKLHALLGGQPVPVRSRRHNLIHQLLKLGKLPGFLADTLASPPDPAALQRWAIVEEEEEE